MSRYKTPGLNLDADAKPDFLARWSRLKQASGVRPDPSDIDAGAATGSNDETAQVERAQQSRPRILTDADMPAIDSLTPDSNFSDFLSPGVSDALRKRALRKLFHSEVFNLRDGLDEYDDDFTKFEKLGDIVTADMRHRMEMEAQRRAEQLLQQDDQREAQGERNEIGGASPGLDKDDTGARVEAETGRKDPAVAAPQAPGPGTDDVRDAAPQDRDRALSADPIDPVSGDSAADADPGYAARPDNSHG